MRERLEELRIFFELSVDEILLIETLVLGGFKAGTKVSIIFVLAKKSNTPSQH